MRFMIRTIIVFCAVLACTAVADARVIQLTKLAFHYTPKITQVVEKSVDDVHEEEFLKLLAAYRQQHKKTTLTYDAGLSHVARKYARYLQDNNHFNHTDKEGKDAGDRLADYGFPLSFWGEILAEGPTTELIFEGFQDSPGHNAIMLSNKYNRVGIGAVGNKRVAVFYYAKPIKK